MAQMAHWLNAANTAPNWILLLIWAVFTVVSFAQGARINDLVRALTLLRVKHHCAMQCLPEEARRHLQEGTDGDIRDLQQEWDLRNIAANAGTPASRKISPPYR